MIDFTHADAGILAVVIDDCRTLGDDATVDALVSTMVSEGIADGAEADDFAYDIVHLGGRDIETPEAFYFRTWSKDGEKRITVTVSKNG